VLPVPVPARLRLLPSSPRVDRSLRLLCELVEGDPGVCSTAPKAGGTGSGRGGSSGGVDVDVDGKCRGGTRRWHRLLRCGIQVDFPQRPCIDLLRALGPG
jgi:hypothetical protein